MTLLHYAMTYIYIVINKNETLLNNNNIVKNKNSSARMNEKDKREYECVDIQWKNEIRIS